MPLVIDDLAEALDGFEPPISASSITRIEAMRFSGVRSDIEAEILFCAIRKRVHDRPEELELERIAVNVLDDRPSGTHAYIVYTPGGMLPFSLYRTD